MGPPREIDPDSGLRRPARFPGAPAREHRARTPRILHLDVDAFLASVEEALHPELRGRPVVVGGSPRSRNLVMSCSYVARRRGVHPGLSLAEAARRCPDAVFRDGDSQAANRLRRRTTEVLMRYTPRVEETSIDDFLVDLTGTERLWGRAFAAAERMRADVRREVGLPVTIGIGTSGMIARLAGKLAKPGGIAEIRPGYEQSFLEGLPVRHLPGVGHSIGPKLERFGIRTVGELRLVPREILFASFGRDGLVLFERARGREAPGEPSSCSPVRPTLTDDGAGGLVARAPRSIRREATFEPEEGRREIVEAMLCYLVERAAHRLRSHRSAARAVEVRLRYVETRPGLTEGVPSTPSVRFRAAEPSSFAKRRRLPRGASPSDSTDELWRLARALLAELPRRRALVKRVGVTLIELVPAGGRQRLLFDDEPEPRAARRGGAPREPGEREPRERKTGERGPGGREPEAPRETRADRRRRLDGVLDGLRDELGFGRVVRGTSLPLSATHPLGRDGFRLRTPSLNQ